MNQLNGKYVNVVLSVECGRGMDFLKNSVHILGNFSNRVLEYKIPHYQGNIGTRNTKNSFKDEKSDKVLGEDTPCFNTELVWEIEKKELRKIRSANQPLRVECITTDAQNRRERVGFALLSLRTAQVIPQKEAYKEINFSWHKLIGCQADKKKSHPELYISLAIRDHLLNELEACSSLASMPYISEEDVATTEDDLQMQFPIKYLEDGHIQIGESDTYSLYQLNLLVINVANLDALLPEVLVFQQIRKTSFLSFKLFGIAIKTKTFQKELHEVINLNEKIVINVMSTKTILREFFATQNITISFVCGTDKLGVTTYNLDQVFSKIEGKYFFKFPSPNGIVPFNSTEKSPYILIQTWVDNDLDEEDMNPEKTRPKTVYSTANRSPILPLSLQSTTLETQKQSQRMTDKHQTGDFIKPFETKSVDKVIREIPVSPTPTMDVYQKYVLEITLQYLVWKTQPSGTKIMFKFLHPKAASCITIFTDICDVVGEQLVLSNICVKMGYISTAAKIQKLLNIWPPKIVLADDKEKRFSEEQEVSVNCSKEYSIDYEILLRACRTLEPLAKIGVTVIMRQKDIENAEEYESLYLLPIVLDELITIKEVTELEMWKKREHDRFQTELGQIKAAEINELQAEFHTRKATLEEQLQNAIKKCHGLQQELRNKLNTLKIEKYIERKANASGSDLYIEIFKKNWKLFSGDNTKEIIELLSKTQRDNEVLKDIVSRQREKLSNVEKSLLTKTQTSSLLNELKVLEEKFEEVKSAKKYFKDQWKKAVEEIHELRTEDLKNMQLQIKESKENLSHLSLDQYNTNRYEDYTIESTRSLKTTLFC